MSAVQIQLGGHRPGSPIRGYALVDEASAEWVGQWNWYLTHGYAARMDHRSRRLVLMHRALLGLQPGDGMETDHINRVKTDNRLENLRVVDHTGNSQNHPPRGGSSRHRGVRRSRNRWQAFAHVEGRFCHLGVFDAEDEAGRVAAAFRAEHMPCATD